MTQNPAAWYPDPFGRYEHRFWDGQQWTHHVVSSGVQQADPDGQGPTLLARQVSREGWWPDPFRRYQHRYWDGCQWTDRVASQGVQAIDRPGGRQELAPVAHGNRKIRKQVDRVGAVNVQPGGGTLHTERVLVVNQKAKLFGSKVEYAVFSASGQRLGSIQELRRDMAAAVGDKIRNRSEARRSRRYRVVDVNGRILIAMNRSGKGWFSGKVPLTVEGPTGLPIGQIVVESFGLRGEAATVAKTAVQSASMLARMAVPGVAGLAAGAAVGSVQDRLNSAAEGIDQRGQARIGLVSSGHRLAAIHAKDAARWDFSVQDPNGSEIAKITKSWAGWAKERFTSADNYVIEMHRQVDDPLRSLILAGALVIDVEFKERGEQTRGSSFSGTRTYK